MRPPGVCNAPLVRVSAVLGQMTEGPWPARLSRSRVDVLRLNQATAQRSRLRAVSDGGTEVAISLERGTQLRDGDVLRWDAANRIALVARIDFGEVLVMDVSALLGEPASTLLERCVEVGHALGNQHWPAVVKDSQIYVPLTLTREVMAAVLNAHRLEGITWFFAPGADVLPHLAPHEARRLFGAAARHQHLPPGAPAEREA